MKEAGVSVRYTNACLCLCDLFSCFSKEKVGKTANSESNAAEAVDKKNKDRCEMFTKRYQK